MQYLGLNVKWFFFILFVLLEGKVVASQNKIEEILDFWFDSRHHAELLYDRSIWWEKSDAFDQEIKIRFSKIRKEAIEGKLNNWLETPKGSLAYILLIDQFSRNIFRGTPQMYAYDYLALAAAKEALRKGFDKSVSFTERVFLYLPFEHSEYICDQKRSLSLFSVLYAEVPEEVKMQAEKYLCYAKDHYNVILLFHRFPHRNKIIGRFNTDAEEHFLKTHSGY